MYTWNAYSPRNHQISIIWSYNLQVKSCLPSAHRHTFPPLRSQFDNFCLQFSRAIASEWLEFIDRLYMVSPTTEKTKGSLVKHSRSLLYESAASAESRLDKQGCQTDVSCRPFFGSVREPDRYSLLSLSLFPLSLSLSLFLLVNHADHLPFGTRSLNSDRAVQESAVVIRKLNCIFLGKHYICTKSRESKDLERTCMTKRYDKFGSVLQFVKFQLKMIFCNDQFTTIYTILTNNKSLIILLSNT